jgi:hypothetical protein
MGNSCLPSERVAASEIMRDHYQAFLERPTAANYRRVRAAILSLPEFDASPLALHELDRLFRRKRLDAARQRVEELLPTWLLSPRFHFLAARLAERLGDEADLELERFVATTCLEGLLLTGDGSRRFPYLITYHSDVHDVLQFQRRRVAQQALHEHRGRRYDVVQCGGGESCWFDSTDLFRGAAAVLDREAAASRA